MKHNRIVFIVPYYGKFPEYFREWVYTAGFLEKQDIDFLLITDIDIPFTLPGNIHIMKMIWYQEIASQESLLQQRIKTM